MDYDLGYFDDETCRLEPLANPFGPKVLPMSSVHPYPICPETDPMPLTGNGIESNYVSVIREM